LSKITSSTVHHLDMKYKEFIFGCWYFDTVTSMSTT